MLKLLQKKQASSTSHVLRSSVEEIFFLLLLLSLLQAFFFYQTYAIHYAIFTCNQKLSQEFSNQLMSSIVAQMDMSFFCPSLKQMRTPYIFIIRKTYVTRICHTWAMRNCHEWSCNDPNRDSHTVWDCYPWLYKNSNILTIQTTDYVQITDIFSSININHRLIQSNF